MDIFSGIALGFEVALSPENLVYCFIGVFIGTFTGALPGIGSLAAVSMLMPITYHLQPTAALIMLAGIYYGSQYGGSIASILLNLPGSPSTAVTCIDGYPMARQGRAGVALFMTAAASFIGGTIGILALSAFGPVLAEVGLSFGPAEYFAMMFLGLIAAGTIAHGSPLKGTAMVVLGLLLGAVGTDINTGVQRFTLGIGSLYEGVPLVAVAMGIFGISEVIRRVNQARPKRTTEDAVTLRSMLPARDDVRRSVMPVARGTGLGAFFGTLPGTGVTIAAFMSYAVEKRISRTPERFGTGAIEGVVGPEAANNSAAQTAFIPTLTLGVPGDATMALLLGTLMIHGLPPGPMLVANHGDLFWGLVASFWIGNVLLLILNIPLVGIWVRMLRIPYSVLYPAILLFVSIGVYTVNNNTFDIMIVVLFGGIGYFMLWLGFEPAPLLVGFFLGPLIEENFRRSLVISKGDPMIFLERPISLALLIATVCLVAWVARASYKRSRKAPVSL
jgi:TctA family transporter